MRNIRWNSGESLENREGVRIFVGNVRIMTTKLTLSLEKEIIERAKVYARKTGRSLSELIETYLDSITREQYEERVSPRLKKLAGSVRLPKNFNEDAELREYFEKKHL